MSEAPFSFLVLIAISGSVGFQIENWHNSGQIVLLERQVKDYQERLGLSPRVSAYAKLTNQELRTLAIGVAKQLRDFQTHIDQESIALSAPLAPSKSPEERTQKFQQWTMQQRAIHQRLQQEYSSTIGPDATNIFKELAARLPTQKEPKTVQDIFDREGSILLSTGILAGPNPALSAGNYIERLARQLP